MNDTLAALAHGLIEHNLLLMQGLGLYALTRWTTSVKASARAGAAVLGALFTASILFWAVEGLIFEGYAMNIPFLVALAFISALFWEKLLSRIWCPSEDRTLVSSLMNTALVGGLFLMEPWGIDGPALAGYGFTVGLGFALALVVMAGIRERLELAPVPRPLRGVPILLIAAGLTAMALMGFRF